MAWIPVASEVVKGVFSLFQSKNDSKECQRLQSKIEETNRQILETQKQAQMEKEETQQKFKQEIQEQQDKLNNLSKEFEDKLNGEIKKRQEENEQHETIMKEQQEKYKGEIENMNKEQLKQRLIQLKNTQMVILNSLKEYKKQTYQLQKEFIRLRKQYDNESSRIVKFKFEREDESVINVLLLGITGHGKSTFANRLFGDTSKKGDQGPFGVSNNPNSKTKLPQKAMSQYQYRNHKISIIDTPGTFDSDNEDRYHMNNLMSYLKGINSINAFIIIKSMGDPRFDSSYQQMINDLEHYLGKSFWKHVILVITKTEILNQENEDFFTEWSLQFRGEIVKKYDLRGQSNIKLPIIGISNHHNYQSSISNLINEHISNLPRYRCDTLRSPIHQLEQRMRIAKKKFEVAQLNQNDINNKFIMIQNDITTTIQALKRLNEPVDENLYLNKINIDENDNVDDDEVKNESILSTQDVKQTQEPRSDTQDFRCLNQNSFNNNDRDESDNTFMQNHSYDTESSWMNQVHSEGMEDKPDTDKWSCEKCTFLNNRNKKCCEVCEWKPGNY